MKRSGGIDCPDDVTGSVCRLIATRWSAWRERDGAVSGRTETKGAHTHGGGQGGEGQEGRRRRGLDAAQLLTPDI